MTNAKLTQEQIDKLVLPNGPYMERERLDRMVAAWVELDKKDKPKNIFEAIARKLRLLKA